MRRKLVGAGVCCLAAALTMIVFRDPLTSRRESRKIGGEDFSLTITLPNDNPDAENTLIAVGLLVGALGVGLIVAGVGSKGP